MHSENKGKIGYVLQSISIIPLLAFGVVTLFLSYRWFMSTMYNEVAQELQYVASNVNTLMEVACPGDYAYVQGDSPRLYKGGVDITDAYEPIDRMKADFDLEITLFYQNIRLLTTIRDSSGNRITGTLAPEIVLSDVLHSGESKFYNKVLVNGSNYFAYYMPLTNSDGAVVGMIFVGKPSSNVNAAIQKSLYPLVAATVITMILVSLLLFRYTQSLVRILHRIRSFLAEVATGNLTAELDASVTGRGDEFGDIGRSAVSMQRSLRTMVEQDSLTELFNRRSAERKLRQLIQKNENRQTSFCVAIGDVDSFKKINDTYGHACGDLILKNISARLREHMRSCGFAARWGGEEFLLVFDNTDMKKAYQILSALLDDIRAMECEHNGWLVKATMTFGLAAGDTGDLTQILKLADERLYIGKNSGKNRIII